MCEMAEFVMLCMMAGGAGLMECGNVSVCVRWVCGCKSMPGLSILDG